MLRLLSSIAIGVLACSTVCSAVILPNPSLTPGATFNVASNDRKTTADSDVNLNFATHLATSTTGPDHSKDATLAALRRQFDVATVCQPGYAGGVRNVPDSEKLAVYKSYGMQAAREGYCSGTEGCEIDHLISLEIGGCNEQTNLWPQPYQGTENAHMKDKLEDWFHTQMCTNKMTMAQVQQEISSNWITAYNNHNIGSMSAENTEEWQRVQAYETMFDQGLDVFGSYHGRNTDTMAKLAEN